MTGTTTTAPFASNQQVDRSIWFLDRTLMTVLATAEETGGQFGLLLAHIRRGSALPPCTHAREDETIYVLEGNLIFHAGNEDFKAGPGVCVFLPRGIEHGFTVESAEAKVLVLVTPGGFEGFFKELSVPAPSLTLPPPPSGPPDMAKLIAAQEKYGITPRPKEEGRD